MQILWRSATVWPFVRPPYLLIWRWYDNPGKEEEEEEEAEEAEAEEEEVEAEEGAAGGSQVPVKVQQAHVGFNNSLALSVCVWKCVCVYGCACAGVRVCLSMCV